MCSAFLFLHLQTTAASRCLEALKLLVGTVSGAGETNPTAAPWLLAVTLASLECTHTPLFHICSVSYPLFHPQHPQKGGRDFPSAALRLLLIPTFPLGI